MGAYDFPTAPSGGSTTFKAAYAAGASSADSIIGLTSTLSSLLVRDNSTPIAGTLFGVQNNAGTTKFLDITDNAANQILSGMTDGASAVALAVDTSAAWANGTAKILSIRNGGTEKTFFHQDGSLRGVGNNKLLTSTSASGYISTDENFGTRVNWSGFTLTIDNGGYLFAGGAVKFATAAAATTTYTVATTDFFVGADATGGAFTITLPSATLSANNGRVIIVKNVKNLTTTITIGGGGTNIDNAATATITTVFGVLRFYSNGTQWFTF